MYNLLLNYNDVSLIRFSTVFPIYPISEDIIALINGQNAQMLG